MDIKSLQDEIIKQEKLLQFEHFSNEDALKIGLMLIEEARERNASPAIDITVNRYKVFRYAFPGTNPHNDLWLKRKTNTVQTVHKSTLHVYTLLEESGEDLLNDWFLDPMDYACMGGGFPITIKDTGVVGCIAVSGLPHLEDHQIIVDTLCKYLNVSLER